jgi:hypothetical protein
MSVKKTLSTPAKPNIFVKNLSSQIILRHFDDVFLSFKTLFDQHIGNLSTKNDADNRKKSKKRTKTNL